LNAYNIEQANAVAVNTAMAATIFITLDSLVNRAAFIVDPLCLFV
jgi:hypothetical protein